MNNLNRTSNKLSLGIASCITSATATGLITGAVLVFRVANSNGTMDEDGFDSWEGETVEPPGSSVGSALFQKGQVVGIDFGRYALKCVN